MEKRDEMIRTRPDCLQRLQKNSNTSLSPVQLKTTTFFISQKNAFSIILPNVKICQFPFVYGYHFLIMDTTVFSPQTDCTIVYLLFDKYLTIL